MSWLAIAAAGVQAIGALKQGADQQAAANYNAERQMEQAQQSRAASAAEAEQKARLYRGKLGEASAAYGASGVTTEGTPLLKMVDLASEAELDRQLTLYRGKIQARSAESQAAMDKYEGKMARQASYFKAASTILGATADYGSKKGWFD